MKRMHLVLGLLLLAAPRVEAWNVINVGGTISGDVTWTFGDPVDPNVYVIGSGTLVTGGLTIEPGVAVKFAERQYPEDQLLLIEGALNAVGTEAAPIVFTSIKDDTVGGDSNGDADASSPAPGDWARLHFSSGSTGVLKYCQVRYGGASGYRQPDANIYSESTLQMTDCVVEDGSLNGVELGGGTATLARCRVINNGWSGLSTAGDASCSAQGCEFRGNGGIGANMAGSGAPEIGGCTFRDNGSDGLRVLSTGYLDGEQTGLLSNNIATDNAGSAFLVGWQVPSQIAGDQWGAQGNGIDAVVIYGNIAGSVNWPALAADLSYCIPSGRVIVADAALTLEPGVVVKFAEAQYPEGQLLVVDGTLNAAGTEAAPVVFTSMKDDSVGGDSNGDGDAS